MSFKMLKHMGFFFRKICKNKIGQFKLELSKNVASKQFVSYLQKRWLCLTIFWNA